MTMSDALPMTNASFNMDADAMQNDATKCSLLVNDANDTNDTSCAGSGAAVERNGDLWEEGEL